MTIDETIDGLRAIFLPHPASEAIASELERILRRRLAAEKANQISEARGLVVLGPSGSGKTTAIQKAIEQKTLILRLQNEDDKPAILVRIPAPSNIKEVGAATLNALGWTAKLPPRWSAMDRWRQVQKLLSDFRVRIIHFDEAQHLAGGHHKELQAAGDALKSRLQDPTWPVALAISATPEFRSVLAQDRQLSRRVVPISMERMSTTSQRSEVRLALKTYIEAAGLRPSETIKSHDFCKRLMISGDRFFAPTCEMIVDAIEEALLAHADELNINHFAQTFRRFSGSLDAYNPFLAQNYERIDVRIVLDGRYADGNDQ